MSNGRFGLGGIFKVNPHHALARTFKSGAPECVACARELENLNSTPQYILTFHALELALKSYLASKGMPASTLKEKIFAWAFKDVGRSQKAWTKFIN